jgi:cephalosporin hydroxylase
MGIPIMQHPSDLMVMQEILFEVKPFVIIETGVAFGGMTKFYADMMLQIHGGDEEENGLVIGVDIDIRDHTIEALGEDIDRGAVQLLKLNSTDNVFADDLRKIYDNNPEDKEYQTTLVSLDSNHSHAHVLKELQLYSPFVSVGSYIVVFDTAIEFYGHLDKHQDRPWGKGNNPYTAVQEFMEGNDEFIVDWEVEARAGITSAPGGWLKRVR